MVPTRKALPKVKPTGDEVCDIATKTPSTLSNAVTGVQATTADGCPRVVLTKTSLAGQLDNTGASASCTATVNVQTATLKLLSDACSVMVVDPKGSRYVRPETNIEGKMDDETTATLSTVTTVGMVKLALLERGAVSRVTVAVDEVAKRFTPAEVKAARVGACVSVTVTRTLQLTVFPEGSEALAVTVVMPTGKSDPFATPSDGEDV